MMSRMSISRRAVSLVAVVFLLVAGGLAALYLRKGSREVTTSSEAAYDAYREGVENSRRFYFKDAQVDFARALSLDPNFAMAMLRLAPLSNRDQALALIERARRLRSRLNERERLFLDLATASDKGTREERLRIAGEIHQKWPNDIDAAMILCEDQMAQGHGEQAIRIYSELLAQDPNNAAVYNQVGYYYAWRGDYDKAIENLKKYQFMAPDQANPYDSLGEVQAYSGHYEEAIGNLNRALALKSDFFESTFHLGVVYEGQGNYAKAIESYEKASREALVDNRRFELLGAALRAGMEAHDRAAVREAASRVMELPKGKNTEVWRAWADVSVDLVEDRTGDAERRLTELKPKLVAMYEKEMTKEGQPKSHFPAWNALMARVKSRQGKTDEAIALYELNVNPPSKWSTFEGRRWVYDARAHLAELVARKGDLDRAEKLLAENQKWNPSWAPTRSAELAVAQLRRDKVLSASAKGAGDLNPAR
jgi:tetratricopeptide (TPR) repeat protein